MKKRQYTQEFKKEAVEYSLTSRKTVEEVARDLGISHHNLNRWRTQYRKDGQLAFPGHGKKNLTPQERDILKKLWPSLPKNRRLLSVYPGTH